MSFQLLVFDSRRGNNEGEEEDKVLGFYPESTPLRERISLAGLLQGLHIFSSSLERPQIQNKFGIIETDSSIWATFEAESGIFLALAAVKTWLPRHVSQENLLGFLMHTHHLMNLLFCGVQYMLEKDETGNLARSSISHVLRNVGDELLNSSSWVNRELRNPLTTLGHAAVLSSLPLSITLDVHSLCHRALTVVHNDIQVTQNCVVLFNRCVLWSSLANEDTAALSALCRSSIFPQQQQPLSVSSSALGVMRGATSPGIAAAVSPSQQGLSGLTGASSSSKNLIQLESGFYVMRGEENNNTSATATAATDNFASDTDTAEQLHQQQINSNSHSYSLPFVYCEASLKYLLAYGRGDLLILILGSHAKLATDALTAIQGALEPLTVQLLTRLAQECQIQGGELGHIPGWRYSVQENTATSIRSTNTDADEEPVAIAVGGVRASPRSKVSAMTHHARAVATAVTDSIGRLKDPEHSLEVCARSTQGVWVVGKFEMEASNGGAENNKHIGVQQQQQQRRSLVVREKRVEGDASQSITSIENSLQSLELI